MDVFLLGTSLSLSAYLPRYLFDSRVERGTMFLAMGLSLSLFSLTMLEAFPKSALILLSRQESLSTAYWILLWLLSIHIIVVLPSLAGSSVAESFGHLILSARATSTNSNFDRDDRKYPLIHWRNMPWWIRFTFGFLNIVLKNICRGICFFSGRRTPSTIDSTPSLSSPSVSSPSSGLGGMATHHDEEMPSSSSAEMEQPASPANRRKSIVSLSSQSNNNQNNYQSRQYLNNKYTTRKGLLITIGVLCGIAITIAMLYAIGPMVVQPPVEDATTTLSRIVSWLCAVGLLISSLLNGFGSVSLPFTYLSGIFLKQVRPETVNKLNSELRSMQDALAKKRVMLKEITVEVSAPPRSSGLQMGRSSATSSSSSNFVKNAATASFLANNGFSDIKEDLKNRRQILQTEIDFLEDLIRETTLDIDELKYSQTVAAAARTNLGKVKSWIGIIFSIILVVRLLNAGISIWSTHGWNSDVIQKKSQSDIVTTTLLWLTGHSYVSRKQYNMLSQMVSLALTAVLSFSQVRTFLRTVTIMNRRLSKIYKKCHCGSTCIANSPNSNNNSLAGGGNDSWGGAVSFHSQLIAGFLGCYSLACIVLIKMMLPEEYSVAFSGALRESDIFTIHSFVINVVFFFSAVVSTAILGMLLAIQRQNSLRHAASLGDKAYYGPDV